MKVKDYISQSIKEFPSLYKDVDYEQSKLKVLCHIFFTIGNGLELAETENPKEGGYVVEPQYDVDRKTDEYIRIEDEPYGEDDCKPLPDGYFDDNSHSMYIHPFSPYPFSKGYSLVCDVFYNDAFLQDDWMEECVILCRRTLEYFNDNTQYNRDSYFPNESQISSDVHYFKQRFDKGGLKGLNGLQKTWGYEVKDSVPDYEEVETRKNKTWDEFHKKQLDFLTKFLTKYDK